MTSIRKYITDAEIEFTGTYMIQGEVSASQAKSLGFYELCGDKILMVSNNGNLLAANPKNNNTLSYNVIFKMPETLKIDFQNIGLLDALILYENLLSGEFETIESAIHNYEERMFVYAKEAQQETKENEIEMLKTDFSFLKFVN